MDLLVLSALVAGLLAAGAGIGGTMSARKRRKAQRPSATTDLLIALSVAATIARQRGHATFGPEHVAIAALENDDVGAALARTETGVGPLREQLTKVLDANARAPWSGEASAEWNAIGRRAATRRPASSRSDLSLEDLLVAMTEAPECEASRLLKATGAQFGGLGHDAVARAPRVADAQALVDGHAYRRVGSPEAAVVFWNDSKTKMETVLEILQRDFAMSETRALHIMLTVHLRGSAAVGVFAREDAEEHARRVSAEAKSRGIPLRVTVDPPRHVEARGWWKRLRERFGK